MAKLSYKEGDFFALPLKGGGFGVGLVARSPKRGRILFGYFFNCVFSVAPTADSIAGLTASEAIYLTRFGDLGLFEGSWQVIGRSTHFDRAHWPMPPFFRKETLSGSVAWLVSYSEDNPGETIGLEVCDPSLTGYHPDGMAGSGYVEAVLARLIGSQPAENHGS